MNFHSKSKFNKVHKSTSCKTADEAKTLNCERFGFGNGTDDEGATVGYFNIPVVIADEWIQVDVESVDRLPKLAREIKRIRKNVHITQCKLVQSQFTNQDPLNDNGVFTPGVLKLFLAGFVRKNIEFVPSCSGAVEHHTVDVPFHCVLPIPTPTDYDDQQLSVKNGVNELVFNDKHGMGMDSKVQGFATYEFFNNKPYCRLEFAGVTELDISEDWKPHCHTFRTVREKMIVEMRLKVLQLQQVPPNGNGTPAPPASE
ncbi:CsxC family protein [Alkalihalobacterium elongatum]|uniref:CsxC family protein n=1 Tax=Alkalihalobacterium elongatum TaxID=2675466 RepID=UPI001C1FCAE6|nr:hypothetical protein [Alkalihalobacterium elongatum]